MSKQKEKPKHSNLGASSAYRWMECPGSVAFLAANPQLKKSSVYADEGTAAHALAEHLIEKARNASVGDNYVRKMYVGKHINIARDQKPGDIKISEHPIEGFIEITEDMVEAVLVYTNEIKDAMGGDEYKELLLESKIDLSFIHPDLYGTNDAIIVRPFDRLTVYDYKHGAGVPVEVENNPQMLYYALGAAHKYRFDFKEIEMVIVQPRCEHFDGPIRRQVISIETLIAFGEEIKKAVARTKEKDAPFSAGKWCRFCDAKPICPKLKSQAYDEMVSDFGSVDAPESAPVLREPSLLNGVEIAKILHAAQMISTWVDSVKEYAHAEAEKGMQIPGYKLVAKRAHRKWKDEALVEKIALDIGFDRDDLFSFKFRSPAQLEKLIGKDKVAELCFVPETGTNLVQEGNKKAAIDVKPDFAALD